MALDPRVDARRCSLGRTEHVHAGSGYNDRRAECRAACEALGIASLRDAPPAAAARLPAPLDRRVRHVLSENARVDAAVAALRDGDLAALGALLDASHASLRDDYEVSVDAVERTRGAAEGRGRGRRADRWAAASAARCSRSSRPRRRRPTTPVVEPAGPARVVQPPT